MSVHELNSEQLEELKMDMYWSMDDNAELLEKYEFPQDIPDSEVFNTFKGVCFTVDDFFCTAGQY